MTQQSESDARQVNPYEQNNQHSKLNRRILWLTWVNMCLLLVWYLLYAEYHSSPWNDGAREFGGFYKAVLVVMVLLTLAVWGCLALAVWRRIR